MAVQQRAKLTFADIEHMPGDGQRVELLDGVLTVTPSPSLLHQRVSRRLQRALEEYFHTARRGEVFNAPVDVILSGHDVLVPDLVVVADRSTLTDRAIEGVPLLVVEILSPSTARHDQVTKAQRYASLGVPHLWLLHPAAKMIECLVNIDGRFVEVLRASNGIFSHPDFEGLSFDVGRLWDEDWAR